jgi:hypothetical protein
LDQQIKLSNAQALGPAYGGWHLLPQYHGLVTFFPSSGRHFVSSSGRHFFPLFEDILSIGRNGKESCYCVVSVKVSVP